MDIKKIDSKYEILSVLNMFSGSLRSLSAGEEFQEKMAEKFAKHGTVITACEKEHVCGFAAYYANDLVTHKAFLSMLAVLPEYRRCGVAKKLLEYMKCHTSGNGMQAIRLEVDSDNTPAQEFYRKNGFVILKNMGSSLFMEYVKTEFIDKGLITKDE